MEVTTKTKSSTDKRFFNISVLIKSLQKRPALIEEIDLNELSFVNMAVLIHKFPEYASRINLDHLSSHEKVKYIAKESNFIYSMDLKKLAPHYVASILARKPELVPHFDVSNFEYYNIKNLLFYQPNLFYLFKLHKFLNNNDTNNSFVLRILEEYYPDIRHIIKDSTIKLPNNFIRAIQEDNTTIFHVLRVLNNQRLSKLLITYILNFQAIEILQYLIKKEPNLPKHFSIPNIINYVCLRFDEEKAISMLTFLKENCSNEYAIATSDKLKYNAQFYSQNREIPLPELTNL